MKENKTICLTLLAVALIGGIAEMATRNLTGCVQNIFKVCITAFDCAITCMPIYKYKLGINKRKAIPALILISTIFSLLSVPSIAIMLLPMGYKAIGFAGLKDVFKYAKTCAKELQRSSIHNEDYVRYDDGKEHIEGKIHARGRNRFVIKDDRHSRRFDMDKFQYVNLSRDRFVLDL